MQRAIPPDPTQARLHAREGGEQREAIGDLYFAADNFVAALEAYQSALSEDTHLTPASRCRLLIRVADVEIQRG